MKNTLKNKLNGDKKNRSRIIPYEATTIKKIETNNYYRIDFTYLNINNECFSDWQKEELKQLSRYIRSLQNKKYEEIQINLSGEDCTESFKTYMKTFSDRFSEDITPIAKHLYIHKKSRIHGFLHSNIFFVIYLDRNHKINKS